VVWVLVGLFGFFLLIGVVFTIGVGMFVHKVKRNPTLAAAKLLTLSNPDVEVVGSDDRADTVTFRDKRTGETITMNLQDIQKGKLTFRNPKGQTATLQAQIDGNHGTVEIKGPDGTMKFGAGADAGKVPEWVPAYPGVNAQTKFSVQAGDGSGGTFSFTTKDPPGAVLSFYEKGLKEAGFKITANITGNVSDASGGMLSGEDEANKRTIVLIVGSENGSTGVNVTFGKKK
jgi:hypothetical protein